MRRRCWRPLLVSARLINCIAFIPSPVTSPIHSLFTQCQGPTCGFLAARPRSHPVPLYLALTFTLTHVRSHVGYLMHDILLPHIFIHCHASSHSRPAPRCRALTLRNCLTFTMARFVLLHAASLCHSTFCLSLTLALSIMLCHSCHALLSHAPLSNYLALTQRVCQ